jgi:hypothetical protein
MLIHCLRILNKFNEVAQLCNCLLFLSVISKIILLATERLILGPSHKHCKTAILRKILFYYQLISLQSIFDSFYNISPVSDSK